MLRHACCTIGMRLHIIGGGGAPWFDASSVVLWSLRTTILLLWPSILRQLIALPLPAIFTPFLRHRGVRRSIVHIYYHDIFRLMFYGTNGGWQAVWGLQLLRWVVEWFCLVVFLMCVVKALVNPSPSCCIVYIEGVGAV